MSSHDLWNRYQFVYSEQYGALLRQKSEWNSLLVIFVLHRLRRLLALRLDETLKISQLLAGFFFRSGPQPQGGRTRLELSREEED